MKKNIFNKYILSCVLSLVTCFISGQTKSNNIQTIEGKKYYLHKVEKGQSLYSISKLYNNTLDEIYLNNPSAKAGIRSGEDLKLLCKDCPATTESSTSNSVANVTDTSKYYTYKVLKRETLYALTKKHSLTEKQLLDYNPILKNGVKEGQIIIIGEKPKFTNPIIIDTEKSKVDSLKLLPPSKPRKNIYNVALLLPFKFKQSLNLNLDELIKNKNNFPTVPGLATDFYLGFMRALDSLTAKDFSIALEVYDLDEKDSSEIIQFVNSPKFKQFDFIFGPLHATTFKTVSLKAKEFNIPIVSPITQQNKLLFNNIYASKTNPSQFTLLECLADYCIDSLIIKGANLILMSPNEKDSKEVAYVKAFKTYYKDKQIKLNKQAKDTLAMVKGLAGIKQTYKVGVKNVVVSLTGNLVFISDFTTQLAMFADKKDITLCGWQSMTEIDNIDQDYLNQMHYTFPHQYNLNSAKTYSAISQDYQRSMGIYPDEYYFIGFDMAIFYLKNLKEKGPDFIHSLDKFSTETTYMRFNFFRPDNTTGFDNRGVYIFRYNNYQLQQTGWK
jgi:LysM repeat protein